MTVPLPRVLLLEPQFVLRRTMVMVARDLGAVDFQEASSVGRARTMLATQPYDGLVLDAQEGEPVLALLDDLRQGRFATPSEAWVVVLAAGGAPADASRLQALRVARVLGKPVRISDLLAAVAQAQESVPSGL